jgi:hypothetical protein
MTTVPENYVQCEECGYGDGVHAPGCWLDPKNQGRHDRQTINDSGGPHRLARATIVVDLGKTESVALLDGFRSGHTLVGVRVGAHGQDVWSIGRVVEIEGHMDEEARLRGSLHAAVDGVRKAEVLRDEAERALDAFLDAKRDEAP